MSFSWYRRYHNTVDGDPLKLLAREAGVAWLFFSGVLGWLFRIASESAPRGTLPSIDPDAYADLAGDPDAGTVVALLLEKNLLVKGEDGLGHFAGWLQEQASAVDNQQPTDAGSRPGRKASIDASLDSIRHYRITGKEPTWMTEGWNAVLKATWSQSGVRSACGVWFRICCPTIAEECGGNELACRTRVAAVVRAVSHEAELAPLRQTARRRHPFTLTNWLSGFRWEDAEYSDETWEQTLNEAKVEAEAKTMKVRSSGFRRGTGRKAAPPSTAERRKGIKNAMDEILAEEYGEDAPERVKAEVLDAATGSQDVAGGAPEGDGVDAPEVSQ